MGPTEKPGVYCQNEIKRSSSMFISKQSRGFSGKQQDQTAKGKKVSKTMTAMDKVQYDVHANTIGATI